MSKRYTFFRMPNGKPYRGLDEKYAPVHVLSRIGETASLNEAGDVSWQGGLMFLLEATLRPAFVVMSLEDYELNETDTWRIVWEAIVASAKNTPGKPINPMDVLRRADESVAAFFRTSPANYVLVTSLSLVNLPAKNIKVLGSTISSLTARGKRFPIPDFLAVQSTRSPLAEHIRSTKYLSVKVRTRGRSIYDAYSNALNSLNLLRGLWSLVAKYRSWTVRYGTLSRDPIGVIHTGPICTLHLPNGKLAEGDVICYDPAYTGDQPIFQDSHGWKQIEKNRRWASRRLATLEFGRDLEALLMRYASALDHADTDVAFLQMWSLLERITDTVGRPYDETIERTVWPFSHQQRPLYRDMLESLRCRRNEYVHSGKAGQESDQAAYLVKYFVDPHLWTLISNPFKVRSLEEYGQLLALPTDATMLKQKQGMLLKALQFRQKKKDPG
ncbi:MAG: hypothetical protein WBW16_09300 [Bacteroidota bacterium]